MTHELQDVYPDGNAPSVHFSGGDPTNVHRHASQAGREARERNVREVRGRPAQGNGNPKGHKPTSPQLHERVRYTKQEHGVTTWDVIFEIVDGKEHFYARKSSGSGMWRKYAPSASEMVTAREIMALERARRRWEATAPEEERVYVMIADLGPFPKCIHQAIHEMRQLLVDGTDNQQIEQARKGMEHSDRGKWLIKQVFEWFEEHRRLREKLHIVQMRQE